MYIYYTCKYATIVTWVYITVNLHPLSMISSISHGIGWHSYLYLKKGLIDLLQPTTDQVLLKNNYDDIRLKFLHHLT